MEIKTIHQALASINRKVGSITKDRQNQEQHYKFRGIDDAYNELHKLFADEGVVILPKFISSVRESRTTSRGTPMIYTISTYEFVFIAEDGSRESATLQGEGNDTSDKSSNKAFSASLKYALFSMFLIPTEDLIDSETETIEVGKEPKQKAKAEPTKPNISEKRWNELINAIKTEPNRKAEFIKLARGNYIFNQFQEDTLTQWEDN